MQSGLGTVSETTQNVYDEVKAKKTPGDNWFGFGFAFFLGWSHIPAPHLKARRVMKGSLALLYYKYKIIYTKLQKEFGMLWNILAWKIGMCGGIKSKEKEWNHLEQRGGKVSQKASASSEGCFGSEGLSRPGGFAVTLWRETNFHSFQFLSSLLIRTETNGALEKTKLLISIFKMETNWGASWWKYSRCK